MSIVPELIVRLLDSTESSSEEGTSDADSVSVRYIAANVERLASSATDEM